MPPFFHDFKFRFHGGNFGVVLPHDFPDEPCPCEEGDLDDGLEFVFAHRRIPGGNRPLPLNVGGGYTTGTFVMIAVDSVPIHPGVTCAPDSVATQTLYP